MHYIYILKSQKNNNLYRGYTNNIKKRFLEHNHGKVKTTKSGIPWEIIYYEGFIDKTDALREERFLKSGKGKERIKLLLQSILHKA